MSGSRHFPWISHEEKNNQHSDIFHDLVLDINLYIRHQKKVDI